MADSKRHRQAKHVRERVRQENQGRNTQKKTCAMLESTWAATKPKSGVTYICFEADGGHLGADINDENEQQVT